MHKTAQELLDSHEVISIPYNDANWVNNESQFERILTLNPFVKTIVEIGSFIGAGSTRVFGKYVKERKGLLICVDPFDIDVDPGLREWCVQCGFTFPLDNMYGQFVSNMGHLGLAEWVLPYKGQASAFFQSPLAAAFKKRVDLVYVDGNHRYEYAKADILNAINTFPEAIICGDDWEDACWQKDIRRAVFEVSASCGRRLYAEKNLWILC